MRYTSLCKLVCMDVLCTAMIRLEIKERVGYITLDRAEKRNALNDQMVNALKEAFKEAYASDDCKVIVLKAEGEVFSAGADLAYLKQLQNNSYEENLADSNALADLFHLIYTGPKVVIAAVQGHAIAGGCGLATVCDFCISSTEARFGYTEVRIGFIPAIVSYFLLRKIGEARTRELLLTGALISADQAMEYGMITQVVPAEQLDDAVAEMLKTLLHKCSGESLKATKELIAGLFDKGVKSGLNFASEMNAKARASEDCKAGISAFLAKEKISW